MGSFVEDSDLQVPRSEARRDQQELRGHWGPDPTGRHTERYFSLGQPTKLYRDGEPESFIEGYDEIGSPSTRPVEPESAKARPEGDAHVCTEPLSISPAAPQEVVGSPQGFHETHRSIPDRPTGSVSMTMDLEDSPSSASTDAMISNLTEVAGMSAIGRTVGPVAMEHVDISFLEPGRVGPVIATATPIHVDKHDGVADVKVFDSGMDNRLMAVATVTVRVLSQS